MHRSTHRPPTTPRSADTVPRAVRTAVSACRAAVPLPRRTPAAWAAAALLSALCWWLLLAGPAVLPGGTASVLGALAGSGLGLSLLPVHCSRRRTGPVRRRRPVRPDPEGPGPGRPDSGRPLSGAPSAGSSSSGSSSAGLPDACPPVSRGPAGPYGCIPGCRVRAAGRQLRAPGGASLCGRRVSGGEGLCGGSAEPGTDPAGRPGTSR